MAQQMLDEDMPSFRRRSAMIQRTASRAGAVRTKNYDNIFEGIMKYADEEEIFDDQSLREQLEKGLDMRRGEPHMTAAAFNRMVTNLARRSRDLPRVRARLRRGTSRRVIPERASVDIRSVPEKDRDKFRKLVGEGREVWSVFDKKKKARSVVYRTAITVKGTRRAAYRQLSGRFGRNPRK